MAETNAENDIIDLSEVDEEGEGLGETDVDDEQGDQSPERDTEPGNATGGDDKEPEAVKPELKIVIRADDKITVGIQRRDTYPVFYTLDNETGLDQLGETLKELVQQADSQWAERPQLNKYEASRRKTPAKTTASASASRSPSRPKPQAATQSGPRLI